MKKRHAFTAFFLAAALTLSAGAAFTPSVEYKEAPKVVEKIDEKGNVSIGEVRNETGEVIANISVGAITITPISMIKTTATAGSATAVVPGKGPNGTGSAGVGPAAEVPAADHGVAESLKAVETEIAAAFEKPEESTLVQEIAKELNDAPVENIVVSDVFAVTVSPEIEEVLKNGASLSVAVVSQSITKQDEKKITIYQKDAKTGLWIKVKFEISEDGIITLELKNVGEIVIFRDNEAPPVTPETAPVSPSTGGDRNPGVQRPAAQNSGNRRNG